jgi:ribosomal protein S18 acetylase RimI-like enzyme
MKDLEFIPITSCTDERLNCLLRLYAGSFPFEERRTKDQLKAMIGHEKMNFIALQAGDQLAGLMIWWNFSRFGYIEHFAVFPELRGNQIGSTALQRIRSRSAKTLLEAEKPSDEMSERRIAFYQRNSFDAVDPHYLQPPYRKKGKPIRMYLLSDFADWSTDDLQTAVALIRKEVYVDYQ